MDLPKLVSDSKLPIAAIVFSNLAIELLSIVLLYLGSRSGGDAHQYKTTAYFAVSVLVCFLLIPSLVAWAAFRLARKGSALEECVAAGLLVALISGGINTVVTTIFGLASLFYFGSGESA